MEQDPPQDHSPDSRDPPVQPLDGAEAQVEPESAPAPDHATVALSFDEDTNVLCASIVPSDEPSAIGLETLQQMVEEGGYGAFSFKADALAGVLRRLQKKEFGDVAIATRLDAGVSVVATADSLAALLTTSRAYGGEPLTAQRIRSALEKTGVAEDLIDAAAIERAVAEVEVSNLIVARGVAPRAGTDSRVELLVDLDSEVSRPREDAQGRVDHYSVREFVIVEAGQRLLRRYTPTRGVAGRDIYGKTIAATDGKDVPLPKDMPGVVPDPEEPEILLAEYKGHPVSIPGGIRVDKTLPLEYVDLRTGNVDFDGSVLVAGDVAAGVRVKASGDLTVKGSVENACLEAGGDLLVGCGITGPESAMKGGVREVLVQAGGTVEAAFASGVHIRAGGDVVVKEYLNHCETYASGSVLVGQSGGHGVIVGGVCHGCLGIAARAIGTPANVRTRVSVGAHGELRSRQREALNERRALLDRLDQLKGTLASLQKGDGDGGDEARHNLVDKVRRTIEEFERRTAEVNGCLKAIAEELEGADEAVVVGDQRVYPGVVVAIGDAELPLRSEVTGGRFFRRAGEVHYE